MFRAYSIFDDFPHELVSTLEANGVLVDCLPAGGMRPQGSELQTILERYDIIFISTGEKITEEMFARINSFRIIGTASRGIDHIHIPTVKRDLVNIVNATSNAVSVAEHVFSLVLALSKRLFDGRSVAAKGLVKREMKSKPQDITGKTMGVIGAGATAEEVIRIARGLHMNCICWTRNPDKHVALKELGVVFSSIEAVLSTADIVSIHIPLSDNTLRLIDSEKIQLLRDDAIFINTSRAEIVDNSVLFEKAKNHSSFSVGIACDPGAVFGLWDERMKNVIVTPHIAGGTVQSRIRLFQDCVAGVLKILTKQTNR